jgi:hypothetical protein
LLLFRRYVLRFRANKRPNFITLETADAQTAYIMVMIGSTGAPHILQEIEDRMLRHARHTDNGIDAAPFYAGGNHLNAFRCAEPIH